MENKTVMKILKLLQASPGKTSIEIFDDLGMQERDIRFLIKELESKGHVRVDEEGKINLAKSIADIENELRPREISISKTHVDAIENRIHRMQIEFEEYRDGIKKTFVEPLEEIVKKCIQEIDTLIDKTKVLRKKTKEMRYDKILQSLNKDKVIFEKRYEIISLEESEKTISGELPSKRTVVVGTGVTSIKRVEYLRGRVMPILLDFSVTAGAAKMIEYKHGTSSGEDDLMDPRHPFVASEYQFEELTTAFPELSDDAKRKVARGFSKLAHYNLNKSAIDKFNPNIVFQKSSLLPPDLGPLDLSYVHEIRRINTWNCIQNACDLVGRSNRMEMPIVGHSSFRDLRDETAFLTKIVRILNSNGNPQIYDERLKGNFDPYIYREFSKDKEISFGLIDHKIYGYVDDLKQLDAQLDAIKEIIRVDDYKASIQTLEPCIFYLNKENQPIRFEFFISGLSPTKRKEYMNYIANIGYALSQPVDWNGKSTTLDRIYTLFPSVVVTATSTAADYANRMANSIIDRIVGRGSF